MTTASPPPGAGEHDRYLAAYDRVVATCSLADGVFELPASHQAVRAVLASGPDYGTAYEDYLAGHQRHWGHGERERHCCEAARTHTHDGAASRVDAPSGA